MKAVKLMERSDDGWEVVGYLRVGRSGVVEGDTDAARDFMKPVYWGGKVHKPEDGESYLDVLPQARRGSYVQAYLVDIEPVRHQRSARPRGSIPGILLDLKAQDVDAFSAGSHG